MKKNIKNIFKERVNRIKFIKTEINQLITKSFIQNKYINSDQSNSCYFLDQNKEEDFRKYSISYFRLYCILNSSPKLVNRKYRLGRFKFNYLANLNKISAILKKGW